MKLPIVKAGQVEMFQQQNDYDCAIACMQMLTGLDRQVLQQEADKHADIYIRAETKRLGSRDKVKYTPEKFGYVEHWLIRDLGYNYRKFNGFVGFYPCMVSIKSINYDGHAHAVVLDVKDGKVEVFDPSLGEKMDLRYIHSALEYSLVLEVRG